jgi:hypothetical protein
MLIWVWHDINNTIISGSGYSELFNNKKVFAEIVFNHENPLPEYKSANYKQIQ